jgi:hypothetical protein
MCQKQSDDLDMHERNFPQQQNRLSLLSEKNRNNFMFTVIIFSVLLIGLAVAGISIKMLLQKDGQFSKSCSSVEFADGKKTECVCGNGDPTSCVNYEKHHGVFKE